MEIQRWRGWKGHRSLPSRNNSVGGVLRHDQRSGSSRTGHAGGGPVAAFLAIGLWELLTEALFLWQKSVSDGS